jgi:hypothetical protein
MMVVTYVEVVGTEEGTWMWGMKGMHAEESAVEYTPRRRQSDWVWEKFSSYLNDAGGMAVYSYHENLTSPLESKVVKMMVVPTSQQTPF